MRKHSARKWLHFILDLLPVIILPIFAIYEINHDQNTPIEVEASESIKVDFNQLVENGKPTSIATWYSWQGGTISYVDYSITCSGGTTPGNYGVAYDLPRNNAIGHKIYACFSASTLDENDSVSVRFRYPFRSSYVNVVNSFDTFSFVDNWSNESPYTFLIQASSNSGADFVVSNLMFIDLTQMFGVGNEPTKEQFEAYYNNDYYDYTLSHYELLNIGTETLSNTDIGSQMIYALYKPVKEYFNFNNVFNFGDIYNWFEFNIFGGTAPMSFFIVWNIVLYQFVMDLVFLIYGLFMWFIDMCEKLMDKPLNSIK